MMSAQLLADLAGLAGSAGATVYLVGGYVRDCLLGREPVDVDLLVEGDPGPFLRALSRAASLEPVVFSRKEPITYRVALGEWLVDVSAFPRGELKQALVRRDFTINALAAPLKAGAAGSLDHTIDPMGGVDDLRRRRIRHISVEGLKEDPLRLLRAVRLAVILEGFTLDADLRAEIHRHASLIASVPAERLLMELEVILGSPRAGAGLRLLADVGMLFSIFPELQPLADLPQNRWHAHDALEHTLRCVEEADALQGGSPSILIEARLGEEDTEVLKWAALHHDCGKASTRRVGEDGEAHFYGHETVSAEISRRALARLKVGSRKAERIESLVLNHLRLTLMSASEHVSDKAVRRLVNQLKYDTPLLCLLALADRRAGGGPDFDLRLARLIELSRQVMIVMLSEGERVISPPPLLSGTEVMEILEIPPGPRVGSVMRWLTRLQVEQKLTRREEAVELLRSLPESRILTLDGEE